MRNMWKRSWLFIEGMWSKGMEKGCYTMKVWKKWILAATLTVLAVSAAACGKNEGNKTAENIVDTPTATPTPTPETTPSEKSFLPKETYVRTIGRTAQVDNTLWLVHSGTGCEFTFTGTSATIKIKPDSSFMTRSNQARVAIYVNGERVVDDMVDKMEKVYTVFERAEAEECTIKVVKLSEAAYSTFGITAIEATCIGDIKPTKGSERLIEFIGDSITCGYGVNDLDSSHHFSTTTEDATKTYAYKTAEKLEADYSFVSLSGYGIISGYSGDGNKQAEQTIPKYYDKLGNSGGTYLGSSVAQETTWDFTMHQPEVIVINLGTNDNSYVKNDPAKKEEYTAAYTAFIKQVREKNPDAAIFCTLGIMGAELYPCMEDAVEQYVKETADAKVHTMKFDTQSMADGIAADWHPSEKTHEKAAEKLAAKIREIMGW